MTGPILITLLYGSVVNRDMPQKQAKLYQFQVIYYVQV
uniref:Uncharacterized protein n=1 Tax=Arundo donax TaxID=35708 RepID=A0A0A8ZBF8_ARUDO